MLLRRSRVLPAVVAVELFWGFAIVAFESLFPIRLAEVLGSTTEAAALMGPASSGPGSRPAAGAALIAIVSRRTGVARAAMGMRILQGLTIVAMGLLAGAIGPDHRLPRVLLHPRRVEPAFDPPPPGGGRGTPHDRGIAQLHGVPPGRCHRCDRADHDCRRTSLSTAMIVAGIACAAAALYCRPSGRRSNTRRLGLTGGCSVGRRLWHGGCASSTWIPVGTASVEDVVRRLGVAAQADASVELAVRVRRQRSKAGEVAKALAEGRIIKCWVMRGAVHL